MKVLKFIKNIVSSLKSLFYLSHSSNGRRYACEIKKFDLQRKEVIIYCYGVRIIIIKSSIADIVNDPNIVVNLPSYQSCLLGYYYGKLCAKSNDGASFLRRGSFLLRFTHGRFKIFSFDREKVVTYIDVQSNKTYRRSPLLMVQDQSIIYQLDSSQACYIGILAGLMVEKQGAQIIKVTKRSILTVIK